MGVRAVSTTWPSIFYGILLCKLISCPPFWWPFGVSCLHCAHPSQTTLSFVLFTLRHLICFLIILIFESLSPAFQRCRLVNCCVVQREARLRVDVCVLMSIPFPISVCCFIFFLLYIV